MGKYNLLVDTDIFIDDLNHRRYRSYLEGQEWRIHYSVVTKKELLSKQGLSSRERQAILSALKRYRQIPLSSAITDRYTTLRGTYPSLAQEETLIAASALVRHMPLLTGNQKHFRLVAGLRLLQLSREPKFTS